MENMEVFPWLAGNRVDFEDYSVLPIQPGVWTRPGGLSSAKIETIRASKKRRSSGELRCVKFLPVFESHRK